MAKQKQPSPSGGRKVIEYDVDGKLKDPLHAAWQPEYDDEEDAQGLAVTVRLARMGGETMIETLTVDTLRDRYQALVAMWQDTFAARGEMTDCCDQRSAMQERLTLWEEWSDARGIANGVFHGVDNDVFADDDS